MGGGGLGGQVQTAGLAAAHHAKQGACSNDCKRGMA